MEPWFIYALLSVFFGGIFMFAQKVVAEKDQNSALAASYGGVFGAALSFLLVIINIPKMHFDDIVLSLTLGVSSGFIYAIVSITRTESLKNIDTTIYMPLYKVLSPIIAVTAGFFLYAERFGPIEIIGILLSLFVPLLLIHKSEKYLQKNLLLGLTLMTISAVGAACAAVLNKYGADNLETLFLFIMFAYISTSVVSFSSFYFDKKQKAYLFEKDLIKWGAINGVTSFLAMYTLLLAFAGGTLGVVYTINSLYIVIPIVLSIIIYKEHWNARKVMAIILSIVALIFLK